MGGQIILGVPGAWESRAKIIEAVAKANRDIGDPRYLALGPIVSDLQRKEMFGFEVYDRDPGLLRAFEVAGQGRFRADELAAIERHTFTLYVVSQEQAPQAARTILELAAFLLDAGGLAVKVETAGVAHTAERWRHYAAAPGILALYDALVTLVGGDEFAYSCGMHNFGLPDASVTARVPLKDAAEVLTAFNQWQLIERPTLKGGDVFQAAETDPAFRVTHQAYGYDEDDLLNNPFGRWHLDLAPPPPHRETHFRSGGEPLFMFLKREDPEVRACVDQARRTLPYFLAHARSPFEWGRRLFKMRLVQGDDVANLWLRLVDVRGETLAGQIFEVPPQFTAFSSGQEVEVPRAEVLDWAVIRHGTLVGGFSLRLQRRHVPAGEQRAHDLFSGTIAYAPLEDIPGFAT